HAARASEQARKARDNYILQMQRRTAEAMQLINQSKQAKLQEQLAQTMSSLQLGDDASTFSDMRDKIDRRAATAEAKPPLARPGEQGPRQLHPTDAASHCGGDAAHQAVEAGQAAGATRADDVFVPTGRRRFNLQRDARQDRPPRRDSRG